MKKTILCFLILAWMSSAQAYPWMFFREQKTGGSIELDSHASYFMKGQFTLFSGLDLEYHNKMVDVNLGYVYSFLEKQQYFHLNELALVFPFLFKDWTMTIGFKDTVWSEADRYWNYGMWQPRYVLDVFRPEQMGLPGFYFNYEDGSSSLLILASYLFVPDIIVYPKLEGKKIISANPFFVNAFNEFDWDIDKLQLFELSRFFKPVMAIQLKHFLKHSNVSLSYAYKPINQFQYSVSLKPINLSTGKKEKITVADFNYFIGSHHLATLEGEAVLGESLSLFASLFYEKPENRTYGRNWLSDDFESHLTFSLLAYFQEKMDEDSQTLFTLGFTQTVEDEPVGFSDNNAVTEDLEQVFGRDFNWKSAVGASLEYQNKQLYEGFLFRFRANHALDNGFYALAVENYLNLTPHIQLYLSGDVLFRFSTENIKPNSSSISKYEDLSRLLVGAKYVF